MAQQPSADTADGSTDTINRAYLDWSLHTEPDDAFKNLVIQTLRESAFIEVEDVQGTLVVKEVTGPVGWTEDPDTAYGEARDE